MQRRVGERVEGTKDEKGGWGGGGTILGTHSYSHPAPPPMSPFVFSFVFLFFSRRGLWWAGGAVVFFCVL
jgi:hypothetical protein